MQTDIRTQHWMTLDMSHHGCPELIRTVQMGNWGHPWFSIDPVFLEWAYAQRMTLSIAHFLNINRDTVHKALLEYGTAELQHAPSNLTSTDPEPDDDSDDDPQDFLDPAVPLPSNLPANLQHPGVPSELSTVSYMGTLSGITDGNLDNLILCLHSHYWCAGISMLDGMLWHLGYHIPHEHIHASLMKIDPMQHVFQRVQIWRRVYSVAGPMLLWHNDGQHGQWLVPSGWCFWPLLQVSSAGA